MPSNCFVLNVLISGIQLGVHSAASLFELRTHRNLPVAREIQSWFTVKRRVRLVPTQTFVCVYLCLYLCLCMCLCMCLCLCLCVCLSGHADLFPAWKILIFGLQKRCYSSAIIIFERTPRSLSFSCAVSSWFTCEKQARLPSTSQCVVNMLAERFFCLCFSTI